MKTLIPTLQFLILMLFAMCGKEDVKFTFQPNYPQPGQEIAISYNPSGTSLEGTDEVTLLAYCFPEGISLVHEVTMKESNSVWSGSFSTADTTLAVYVIFKSGDQQDDNNKVGYLISQFNANKKPIKGGMARHAEVLFSGGSHPLRLQRDWEKAIDFYEEEFKLYPEQNQNWKMVNSYWYPFYELQKDSATTIIRTGLDKLGQKEDKTTTEYSVLINWHQRLMDKELADTYEKELLKRDPKGYHVEFNHYMECARETAIDKKLQLTLTFMDDFPHSEYHEQLNGNMISSYAKKNLFKEAEDYIDNYVKNPSSGFLDDLARPMLKRDIRLERAVELAELAVNKARVEQENADRPSNYTRKEWQEKQNSYLGDILDTYGFGLYKTEKIEESVKVYAEAVELNQRKSSSICKRYSRSLFETDQIEKAFNELELIVKKNPKDQELNAFFKEVYVKYKGNENGLESFFIEANEQVRLKKLEQIKEQMMEKPAPDFALKDLDGDMVRLADFKGKIVVLDFWGIWCGLCLESFPAMQQEVNKYKDDDKIKFLFIDTLEEIENVEEKVRRIINKNNYTFHVLLDMNNSVANDYKITEAPVKIIIDPNGKIRFLSKGYGGDDKLIEELDMMIAMLR